MPVNVNDVYLKVQDLLNKNQNGILSPKEFNRLSSMASTNLFNKYYGSPQAYRYDKPLPRIAYGQTQYISEALAPFVKSQIPATSTLGVVTIPADKIHLLNIRHNYNTTKYASCRRVEIDRLDSWLSSSIDAPTLEFPIYTESSDTLNVFPSSITNVLLTYLRAPIDAVWGYTLVGNRPVYNAGTSTNFEWDSEETNNLVMEIVSLAGASLKDNDAIAYAEASKRGEA